MNVPLEVRCETGALILVWSGGLRQHLPLASLRRACPCAGCRRERMNGNTGANMGDRAGDTAHEDLTLTGIVPMGYGVQLVFSDGHDRGIFPWAWFEHFAAPIQPATPDHTSAPTTRTATGVSAAPSHGPSMQ
ncbi:hypothetical protein LMG28688_02080 [Paraburkholderia caffeinitolerans]|uniref:Gamma-butyrobetaine hydroxylase-like N-terminal domain-containing protein n=1 Tax=Paraburkholderia caffeinitolerans TaxID=1723730 RepID=A0A6J5FUH9_9BURK|nr:DUF971 domain-containing protein [Paraburkholderia caffeinitolerans]CAB3785640.1 hypothetical protein LMG28688_02080 [Paraburkholderia caffeinitolerans]